MPPQPPPSITIRFIHHTESHRATIWIWKWKKNVAWLAQFLKLCTAFSGDLPQVSFILFFNKKQEKKMLHTGQNNVKWNYNLRRVHSTWKPAVAVKLFFCFCLVVILLLLLALVVVCHKTTVRDALCRQRSIRDYMSTLTLVDGSALLRPPPPLTTLNIRMKIRWMYWWTWNSSSANPSGIGFKIGIENPFTEYNEGASSITRCTWQILEWIWRQSRYCLIQEERTIFD